MKPYIHGGICILWTIDASVGKRAANSVPADVAYIQWYYQLASTFRETPPERQAIYRKVQVTGHCTGQDSDPLVQAIIAHQQGLNHPVVDGKVSVLSGSAGDQRLIGGNAFMVLRIGARIAYMFPDLWPRLDKMPGCPKVVADVVKISVPLPGQ